MILDVTGADDPMAFVSQTTKGLKNKPPKATNKNQGYKKKQPRLQKNLSEGKKKTGLKQKLQYDSGSPSAHALSCRRGPDGPIIKKIENHVPPHTMTEPSI